MEDSSENKVSDNKKAVYLTFDDGPSDNTYNILDILDRYKVKATFFVNGKEDDKYKALYKEITDRGSSLGMHSYTHDVKIVYGSLESFAEDTEKIHDYLYNLTGKNITLYRFPGGSSTKNTSNISQYIDYLNVKGYTYYDWNVSSGDAVKEELSAEIIVSNVMNGVKEKNGGIVLLHDSAAKDTTVEALPIIIEKLLNEGYEILPILDTTPPVQHRGNETLGG